MGIPSDQGADEFGASSLGVSDDVEPGICHSGNAGPTASRFHLIPSASTLNSKSATGTNHGAWRCHQVSRGTQSVQYAGSATCGGVMPSCSMQPTRAAASSVGS